MKINVIRNVFEPKFTTGKWLIDGMQVCLTLEDLDRGLDSSMSLEEIRKIKVFGETAIPYGTYRVGKLYWAKFNAWYPHIQDVPGFAGILVHGGVTDLDTEGCILIGTSLPSPDKLLGSPEAKAAVFPRIFKALNEGEEVWITISRE